MYFSYKTQASALDGLWCAMVLSMSLKAVSHDLNFTSASVRSRAWKRGAVQQNCLSMDHTG